MSIPFCEIYYTLSTDSSNCEDFQHFFQNSILLKILNVSTKSFKKNLPHLTQVEQVWENVELKQRNLQPFYSIFRPQKTFRLN